MAGAAATQVAPRLLFERVQELQERLDRHGDKPLRALADELVAALVEMYGEGLARVLAAVRDAGEAGEAIASRLADDPLVCTLLLIHDLHPVALEQRVAQALDSVRPYMESHGGFVELLSLRDGVARIRLRGSCSDCSASSVTLELAIKQALEEAAPDLAGLEVEGVTPHPTSKGPSVVVAGSADRGDAPAPSWFEVDELACLDEGDLRAVNVCGQALVVANVQGTLLAYRDACAGCGAPLGRGKLAAGALRCPGCGRSFSLPRAGRSLDEQHLQLEPVPLLCERGSVRVALVA